MHRERDCPSLRNTFVTEQGGNERTRWQVVLGCEGEDRELLTEVPMILRPRQASAGVSTAGRSGLEESRQPHWVTVKRTIKGPLADQAPSPLSSPNPMARPISPSVLSNPDTGVMKAE